jgi:hypothetical protein
MGSEGSEGGGAIAHVRVMGEITVKISSNFDIKWFRIAVEHEQAAVEARARAVAAPDGSTEMAEAFDDEA